MCLSDTCLFFRDANCWKGGYHLLLCWWWACVFQLSQQLWVEEREGKPVSEDGTKRSRNPCEQSKTRIKEQEQEEVADSVTVLRVQHYLVH